MDAALLGIDGLLGPDGQIEVELVEGGRPDLARPGAGQHAKTDDAGGALILVNGQSPGRAFDLLEGPEAIAGNIGPKTLPESRNVRPHFPEHRHREHHAHDLAYAVCTRRLGRGQFPSPLLPGKPSL